MAVKSGPSTWTRRSPIRSSSLRRCIGMHADEQAVHRVWVEYAVLVSGQPGDDPGRALVTARAELLDHLGAPDREPVAAVGIHRRDQIGNLKLVHEAEPYGLPCPAQRANCPRL
jgi:hypothetical protein